MVNPYKSPEEVEIVRAEVRPISPGELAWRTFIVLLVTFVIGMCLWAVTDAVIYQN